MSTENRDPLDNTTVDDPEFALNCNTNIDIFELERTIVRQRQTAILNQIVRDATNSNSSSGPTTDPPAAAAAAAPDEPPSPPAAAAAVPTEDNCPPHHVHILNRFSLQPPDLLEVITNHLQTLEFHHLDPALARAAARAAVTVIAATRMDPAARAAVDRVEAEHQALLAEMAAVAAELPAVPAASAVVAPEPSEPPAAAAAAAAPEPSEPPAAATATATAKAKAKAIGKKRGRPTEEAKGQHKQKRKNKMVRIQKEEVSEIESESEYELVFDPDFEEPFRVKKTKK